MKGMVGIAIVLLFVGIAYVLINRPAVPSNVTGPNTSNAIFPVFGNLLSKAVTSLSTGGNKVAPPSGVQDVGGDNGTYVQGDTTVSGNTLTQDSSGNTLTYGTD